jgi:hypothetical protein
MKPSPATVAALQKDRGRKTTKTRRLEAHQRHHAERSAASLASTGENGDLNFHISQKRTRFSKKMKNTWI